ncbi:hypothetical protein [Flavobacterium sp. XGLA_31]|uniref:hypothetical protein n=1 Tax=Flavobacterium sp. XGLA_31 TaxID=3447666 RepID=UPI003F316927
MKTAKFILAIVLGIFLTSCESNTYSEVLGAVPNPTYEANIKPLMSAKCTSCHGVGGTEEGSKLDTYDDVTAYSESIICRMNGNSCGLLMPTEGKLPSAQIKMFEDWVAQGMIQQ